MVYTMYMKTCNNCKDTAVGSMYLLDNKKICRKCAIKILEKNKDEQ